MIPSAATYQIVDLRYADTDGNYTVQAAGPATIDSVSTTTTAACGRSSEDASLITLASVANVAAGRRYLLSNSKGQSEPVMVAGIDAGTLKVRAAAEPQRSYATGSTFKGLEISGTVPADLCDADTTFDARLAVIWTFTGVSPARVIEHLTLVRPAPSYATLDDLVSLDPSLATRGGPGADLATALAMAHRDLASDLRCAGLNPYTYNPGPLGADLVLYRAAWHVLKANTDDSAAERAKAYLARYMELRNNLTTGRDKAGVSEVYAPTGQAKAPDIRSLFYGI
ncbi:hypothetical protein [Nannocystis pusilla]|uniref:hypothetical protein n=1 Tax=Nannocystis pusilla TaxID=889268 RepID=UPI003DA43AE3